MSIRHLKFKIKRMRFDQTCFSKFSHLLLVSWVVLASTQRSQAQIVIGTSSPHISAQLEVNSTNKGFLPPRVQLTATNATTPITTPSTGLLVYNTATVGTTPNSVTPGFYYDVGSKWQSVINQLSRSSKQAFAT